MASALQVRMSLFAATHVQETADAGATVGAQQTHKHIEGMFNALGPGFFHDGAGAFQGLGRGAHDAVCICIRFDHSVVGVHGDSQAFDRNGSRIVQRRRRKTRVNAIRAGHDRQQQAQIFDVARHRASSGHRTRDAPGRRKITAHGHQPFCWLDAGDAGKVARESNATAHVGARFKRYTSGGDDGRASSATTSRCPRRVVGIVGSAVDQVVAFKGVGKLGRVGETDRNGSSRFETRDHGSILRWTIISAAESSARTRTIHRLPSFFYGHRHTVQGALGFAVGLRCIRQASLGARRFSQ